MHYLLVILTLFSTAFAEKCDLFDLCKEKEKLKCWPESENEIEAFANQFTNFGDLKCVKDVLLNKMLPSKVSLEKRIKDLANYGCFRTMSIILVEELYAHDETPEYLKMIPVITLHDGFGEKNDFKHMIGLMKYQKYYHLGESSILDEFGKALFDFLEEDSKKEGFSWLADPMWVAFTEAWYHKDEILALFVTIGKEIEKSHKDEMKAIFTLIVTRFLYWFVDKNPSFFEDDDRGREIFDLLTNVIQSVADDELRSVLEFTPHFSNGIYKKIYTGTYEYQGFHSIKILWKFLKKIGHENNAANIMLHVFEYAFRNKCFVWNASKDNSGQEMFAAILNVASNTYEFHDAKDVIAMANGLEDGVMPAKIKKYGKFLNGTANLGDFNYESQDYYIAAKFYTKENLDSIESLMKQSLQELQNTISLLQYDSMRELLRRLCNFSSFPNKVRDWFRSYPVCSILIKQLLSVELPDKAPISHLYYSVYFLLHHVPFNDLELFDDGKGSLAASYLLLSTLLQTQAQTLEWLFSVRRVMLIFLKSTREITCAHVELLWTYRLVLNELVEALELIEDKSTERGQKDSYIFKTILQNFGPHLETFNRNLENMPLKWTLTVKTLDTTTAIVLVDPETELDNNSEKLSLAKVVKTLVKHFDNQLKWEYITDYLRSIDLDFMTVKEFTDELLNGISKKENWDTKQKQFVHDIFTCYRLDLHERPKLRKELASAFRSNAQVLSTLTKFVSLPFLTWIPSPYESIKEFRSTVLRKIKDNPKLTLKTSDSLPSFEDALHRNSEMLAQFNSSIMYLYKFSDQHIQDLVKEILDKHFKLFKTTDTGSFIPAWAISKETGKVIGILLGKCIQNSTPFPASLDPAFLSLLLDPSNAKIKAYYKTHYMEDFNDYTSQIKSPDKKGLQSGFDKLLVPEVCHIRCTSINSVSNLLSPNIDSQMKTIPDWNYLITDYLELINYKVELAFYEMVLKVQKGLLMALNEEIWNRIHKVEHVEDLLRAKRN